MESSQNPAPNRNLTAQVGTWWPVALTLIVSLAAAPWLVGPPCPKRVVMASGPEDGAYYRYANRYRDLLAKDGVDLVVVPTSGARENLQRLVADDQGVSLALFQGGAASSQEHVESLGSVYHEPLWVFVRGDITIEHLTDLAGKRIAVGANGSGTQPLVTDLLRANGVVHNRQRTQWFSIGGQVAAEALENGSVDAAMFVTAVESPLVNRLIARDDIQLLNFQRVGAYEAKFRVLTGVVLPEGAVSLADNRPREPVQLLAPPASVIARDDLHPAIVPLMMDAMIEVHGEGETLSKPGEFPSTHHVTFPMREMSRHYLKYGPSILYRLLPFWVAAWIDRTKLLMLPLVTLLLPALRLAPPVYRWRVRRRIYRWYGVIRDVDEQLRTGTLVSPRRAVKRLEEVDAAVSEVVVPMGYMEEYFNLRQNLDEVRDRLEGHDPQEVRRAA